jgi:hypothetical protein
VPLDLDRFAKVLGMLTSTHDGEQLAAVKRANTMLAAERMTWGVRARQGGISPPPPLSDHNAQARGRASWSLTDGR